MLIEAPARAHPLARLRQPRSPHTLPPAGLSGPYSITVTATNINSDGVPGNASALDQDFALVAYNACDTQGVVPTGVTATANGNNRIDINWDPNVSTSYAIAYFTWTEI